MVAGELWDGFGREAGFSTTLRFGRNDRAACGLNSRVLGDWGVRDVGGGADGVEVEGGGDLADGLVGLGVLGEGDEGAVGAEDAGLFAGDLADGVAEVVLVVEGDVGDDGEEGVDDVGGVEAASEAYFEDGYVDLLLGEVEEGEGGEDFEEAGVVREGGFGDEAAGGVVDVEVEAGEVVVGDGDAVDLDALVDAGEVRARCRGRCGSRRR